MLRVVDESYCPPEKEPSLIEISRHVREAAEHLTAAYRMLDQTSLNDRARLQFTIYAAVAKLAPVVTAVTAEVLVGRNRG